MIHFTPDLLRLTQTSEVHLLEELRVFFQADLGSWGIAKTTAKKSKKADDLSRLVVQLRYTLSPQISMHRFVRGLEAILNAVAHSLSAASSQPVSVPVASTQAVLPWHFIVPYAIQRCTCLYLQLYLAVPRAEQCTTHRE